MPNTLIAYYSLTGHTRQVAEGIAAALDANLDPIADAFNRDTGLGRLRASVEGLLGVRGNIAASTVDVATYNLVVIGGPVWAARLSSPVRAYVHQQRDKLPRVAFFATQGGIGGAWALQSMAKICRQQPIARLIIAERQLDTSVAEAKIAQFVAAINDG